MQAYARGLSALAAVAALTVANAAMADIRIGFTGVLSGPQAALGQDQYDGLMLGIEQLGGSLGGQKAVVIRDDDQLKPDVGAQIVQKFIEKDKVDVIVGLGFSNVLMAELRRIKESGVVALSTNAGPAPIAGRMCLPNLFVLGWQNDSMSEAMGKYVKDQGYKRAYLMSSNYQPARTSWRASSASMAPRPPTRSTPSWGSWIIRPRSRACSRPRPTRCSCSTPVGWA